MNVCPLATFLQYPQKPAEGIRSPEIEVTGGCWGCISPPEEQSGILTTESLLPPNRRYVNCVFSLTSNKENVK